MRLDIRPLTAPALIVSVTRLRPDPARTVGESAAAGSTRLGMVLDLSHVERQALARFTQDAEPRDAAGVLRRVAQRALILLFVADVVGHPGRRVVEERLPALRDELDVDVCIVNGENVADGVGLTPKLAQKLLAAGADAITLGNHTWRRPELATWIDTTDRVVRPANFSSAALGRGLIVVPAGTGSLVVNVRLLALPRELVAPVRGDRRARRGGAARDARDRRRRARGGDEREGRRALARRTRHGSARHAHARADERSARGPRKRPRSPTRA